MIFANNVFQSVSPFHYLNSVLHRIEFEILMKSILLNFVLINYAFVITCQHSPKFLRLSSMFSSKCFIAFHFTSKFIIHFLNFILVKGLQCVPVSDLHMAHGYLIAPLLLVEVIIIFISWTLLLSQT